MPYERDREREADPTFAALMQERIAHLQQIKECFLGPDVIAVLMQWLQEPLSKDTRCSSTYP